MTEIQDYKMGEFETLYHYTSADGLKSIIENKTLRFSDYRFLNDIDEIQYGKNIFLNVISKLKKKYDDKISVLEYWEETVKKIENVKVPYFKNLSISKDNVVNMTQCFNDNLRFYLLSLTTLSDNKDMWNMYSGNNPGYRLKINSHKLLDYFHSIRDSYIKLDIVFLPDFHSAIHYGEESEKIVHSVLEDCLSRNEMDIVQGGSIFNILAFIKDEAFRSEKEYRFGFYFLDEMEKVNNQEYVKKVFLNKNGVFYPYMEFQQFPFGDIVEEIMISPYNKSELAEIGLKELLRENKLEHIKIEKSRIKIR